MYLILEKSVKKGMDTPIKKRVKYGKAKGKVKKLDPILTSHYNLMGYEEIHEYVKHEFNSFNGLGDYSTNKVVLCENIVKNNTFFKELAIVRELAKNMPSDIHIRFKPIFDFKPTNQIPSQWYYLDKDKKEVFIDLGQRKKAIQPYFNLLKTQKIDYLGKTTLPTVIVEHRSVNYILTRAVILALGKNMKNWNVVKEGKPFGWHRLNVKGKLVNSEGEHELIEPSVWESVKIRPIMEGENESEYNKLIEEKHPSIYITKTVREQYNMFAISDVVITNVLFTPNGSVERVFFDKATIKRYKHLESLDTTLQSLQYLTDFSY